MTPLHPMIRLNRGGTLHVGDSKTPLDDIVSAHRAGEKSDEILARFPGLTSAELTAALDYHFEQGNDTPPRGVEQRDAHWQKWNATLKEDLGTDTPPNRPISGTSARRE